MKKIFIAVISCLLLVGCSLKGALAYEFPENCYYVVVDHQTFGEIKVYIPSNQIDLLQISKDDPAIVNVSSGSVYGYFTHSGTDYRITFSVFDTPTYRATSGTGVSSNDFLINFIVDTNISHFKEDSSKTPLERLSDFADDRYILLTLLLIFGIGVLSWLKH